ncbi:MAG: HlyD family efflux transporter periplasmic adaptor subunit [Angelakisella sp.]
MKKLLTCFCTILFILGVGILPERILSGLDHYTVTSPGRYSYQPLISCNGVVLAQEGVRMLVSANLIIKELGVPSGSWVEAGQFIALTQTPEPKQAFLSQSIDLPTSQLSASQLEGLAAQYGVEVPSTGVEGLQTLEKQLHETKISNFEAVAPISGILSWGSVTAERYLPSGSQLCTILGLDCYKAVVQVTAEEAKQISLGALAEVSGKEIGESRYCGTVTAIGNSVTRSVSTGGYSSAVEVEIALDVPADAIRHGASVACNIHTGTAQTVTTVPYEAVQQDQNNREFVYRVVGNKIIKQPIATGIELNDAIEVVAGILPKDIILTGAERPGERFILEHTQQTKKD